MKPCILNNVFKVCHITITTIFFCICVYLLQKKDIIHIFVIYLNICLTVQVLHVVVTQTCTCILAYSGTSLWWCLHGRLLLLCAVGTLWSSNLLNRPHYQPYTWLHSSKRYLHYCCSPWQWYMNKEYAEKSHKPAFINSWDLCICE